MLADNYKKPTLSVCALVLFGNKILLLKSGKWKGKYVFPGGRVKWGELTAKALLREIKEETGLKIKINSIKLIAIHENIFSRQYRKKEHFISFEYCCRASDNKVIISDEHIDYIWVNIKSALKLNLDRFTKKTIKKYLENQGRR